MYNKILPLQAMSATSREIVFYSVAGALGLTATAAGLCLLARKAYQRSTVIILYRYVIITDYSLSSGSTGIVV